MSDGTITSANIADDFLELKLKNGDTKTVFIQRPLTAAPLQKEETDLDHGTAYGNRDMTISIEFDKDETKANLVLNVLSEKISPEYSIPVNVAKQLMETLDDYADVRNGGKSRRGKSKKATRRRKTKATRRRQTRTTRSIAK